MNKEIMNDFREIGLELARAVETTARATMPLSGKGDKNGADARAVETLRKALGEADFNMRVIIGEGEKDDAPMLYAGEVLGKRANQAGEPYLELIVDPLECTTNFAKGLPDSMCVLAAISENCVQTVPGTYMEQLLVPPAAAELMPDKISLDTPVEETLRLTAEGLGRTVGDLTVVVQDRPRHKELIEAIRAAGAGVSLIESGSISAALEIILEKPRRLNMLWGTFGAPEGLIMAFMAAQAGYGFLGRIKPHDDKTQDQTNDLGLLNRTLTAREWIRGKGVLVMSGIHTSTSLPGVEFKDASMRVHTLVWTGGEKFLAVHVDGSLRELKKY